MFLSKVLQSSAFSSVAKSGALLKGEGTQSIQFFTTCPEPWGGSEELWAGAARRLAGKEYRITANLTFFDPTHPQIKRLIESGVRLEKYRGVPLFWGYHGFSGRCEPG